MMVLDSKMAATFAGASFEHVNYDPAYVHHQGVFKIAGFAFESGQVRDTRVYFETWGELNPDGSNAVVICHALTGDAHVAASREGKGWWSDIVGPGCLIDTNRYFVVAANVLGGCSGSDGPSTVGPEGCPYALTFPLVTIRDMVKSQVALVNALGISTIALVMGGSLGGMQAWEWPLLAPGRVINTVVVAAQAAFSALGIGYNEAMRQAITADKHWRQGNYYGRTHPTRGLAAARTIGMLTYRTGALLQARHGRKVATTSGAGMRWSDTRETAAVQAFTEAAYDVESYLQHQGEKFNRRFDANSYLYLTRAMDGHDIGRDRGGTARAMALLKTRLTVIGIDSDYLYSAHELKQAVELTQHAGVDAHYLELSSDYGHDAFLMEQERIATLLRCEGGLVL